jgi:isocitrate dehydrogenase
VSLEDIGLKEGNQRAAILSKTLDRATERLLDNRKSPSQKVGELDNRGSQFYLALYWAQEISSQSNDLDLAGAFKQVARYLTDHESIILREINATQGQPADVGGYYKVDDTKADQVMRPSKTFNEALALIG